MTAQEFLSQVYKLDLQIKAQIEELNYIHSLAEKVTSVITGMPGSANKNGMEDSIIRCTILEEKITQDIGAMIDLRRQAAEVIAAVRNVDCRLILAKRYLQYKQWEDIADEMGYSRENIFRLHRKALKIVENYTLKYTKIQ